MNDNIKDHNLVDHGMQNCPCCESNACYRQSLEDGNTSWLCFGCGRSASTYMKEGNELHLTAEQGLPELFKDLKFVDEDKNVWFPSVITLPQRGMVSIDGTGLQDWRWMGVKAVLISEEERDRFPKEHLYKMDYGNTKHFGQRDFIDSLEYIGFFEL